LGPFTFQVPKTIPQENNYRTFLGLIHTNNIFMEQMLARKIE
jgi:hypothetical protein